MLLSKVLQDALPDLKRGFGVVDDADQVHLVENFSVSTAFINYARRGNLGDKNEIL